VAEPFAHLAVSARQALAEGDQARLNYIEIRRWFDYPKATHILSRLEKMVKYPDVDRTPCLLVVGSSNNGKSTLAKKFCGKHPPEIDDAQSVLRAPVLYIRSIANPTPEALMITILSLLGLPDNSQKPLRLKARVYRVLKDIGVRVLVLDELNTIVPLTVPKREAFLSELRSLSVNTGVAVVCFTTKAGAMATSYDEAFTSRFPVEDLPVWDMGMPWRTLVANFEAYLPFEEPSGLSSTSISTELLRLTDHRLGELRDLFEWVSEYGIKHRAKKITLELIKASNWTPPQERRNRINNLRA